MHRIPPLPLPRLLPFALAGFLAAAPFGAVAQQLSPVDLARKNACMACHGLVHKQVGPGFAQVAERYRGDPTKPAALAAKIRSGSVGTWGRVIMPRQPKMTVAESETLARWVLAQPPRP